MINDWLIVVDECWVGTVCCLIVAVGNNDDWHDVIIIIVGINNDCWLGCGK
jgi:hypothetical protein